MPGPPTHATGAGPTPGWAASGAAPLTPEQGFRSKSSGAGSPKHGLPGVGGRMRKVCLLVELHLATRPQSEPPDAGHSGKDAEGGGRLGDFARAVGHGTDVTRRTVGPSLRGRRCSHVLLLIFFAFSYLILEFPLRATRNIGDMQRSTFRTSPNERLRRRNHGPALTLIVGIAGVPCTSIREARPTHPGQVGFTPDGIPSDSPGSTVHLSEPGSSSPANPSRGNTTLDSAGLTSTGSGPNDHRAMLLHRIAEFLEVHAGDDRYSAPVTEVRLIR